MSLWRKGAYRVRHLSSYQSKIFSKVLQYVQTHPQQCKMKEKQTRNGLRLLLSFDKITSVDKALKVLEPLNFTKKTENIVKDEV